MYQKTDVMILLHFRLYKGKKTPLLRKHSICSDPQRCCFIFCLKSLVLITYSVILPQEGPSPLSLLLAKCHSIFLFSLVGFKLAPGTVSLQPAPSDIGCLFPWGGFSLLRLRCSKAVFQRIKLIQQP